MRQAQNNPNQNVNRPSYPNQRSAAPYMPPQGGAQRPQQTAQAQSGARAAQDASVYRPTAPSQMGQPSAGGTQTFTPIRETRPYQPTANAGSRLQLDVKRDPSARPLVVRPQTNAAGSAYGTPNAANDLDALAQDVRTTAQTAARPTNPSSPLNLNIKVASPILEDISPAEQEQASPIRRRVRRTERNKDLYDQEDPTDHA